MNGKIEAPIPETTFYLWTKTPISDTDFTRQLYQDYNVTVLLGSYLAREAHSVNPGNNFIRMAMVPPLSESVEATKRIKTFCNSLVKS